MPHAEIDSSRLEALLRCGTVADAWQVLEAMASRDLQSPQDWVSWQVAFGGSRFGLIEHVAHNFSHGCFAALCELGYRYHWAFLDEESKKNFDAQFEIAIVKLCVNADLKKDPPKRHRALEQLTSATACYLGRRGVNEWQVQVDRWKNTVSMRESGAALEAGINMARSDLERAELRLA